MKYDVYEEYDLTEAIGESIGEEKVSCNKIKTIGCIVVVTIIVLALIIFTKVAL